MALRRTRRRASCSRVGYLRERIAPRAQGGRDAYLVAFVNVNDYRCHGDIPRHLKRHVQDLDGSSFPGEQALQSAGRQVDHQCSQLTRPILACIYHCTVRIFGVRGQVEVKVRVKIYQ